MSGRARLGVKRRAAASFRTLRLLCTHAKSTFDTP
jgi:hypothetical protein